MAIGSRAMRCRMLKSKIHRATVTDACVHYEGSITVDSEHGPTLVRAGQAVIARGGEWVRYFTDEGARYIAVCVPAFSIETVHRSDEDISVIDPE